MLCDAAGSPLRCFPGKRRKREPGVKPGLPRSGKRERKSSRRAERRKASASDDHGELRGPTEHIVPGGAPACPRVRIPAGRPRLRARGHCTYELARREHVTVVDSVGATRMRVDESPEDQLATLVRTQARDLPEVDPDRVVRRVVAGLNDGADRGAAADLAVRTAAELIAEEPAYSRLAARLLAGRIADEAAEAGVDSFSAGIALGSREGIIGAENAAVVAEHGAELDA